VVKKFGLDENTNDFLGHAVALYTTDDYIKQPALQTIEKLKLYANSMDTFGSSPFIYPIYGLAGIPEGFSRKCAVHGGTYMLNQSIDRFVLNEEKKFASVEQGKDKKANAPIIIAHPRYLINSGLNEKVKNIGRVIRSICI